MKDYGVYSDEAANWAEYGAKAAAAVSADPENTVGILVCGSGIGMSIVANKFKHVRAALCRDENDAKTARSHNNANVLALGRPGDRSGDGAAHRRRLPRNHLRRRTAPGPARFPEP